MDVDTIHQEHIALLSQSGYRVAQQFPSSGGTYYEALEVADPVLCSSGRRQWAEIRFVTLRTRTDVYRFLMDRS